MFGWIKRIIHFGRIKCKIHFSLYFYSRKKNTESFWYVYFWFINFKMHLSTGLSLNECYKCILGVTLDSTFGWMKINLKFCLSRKMAGDFLICSIWLFKKIKIRIQTIFSCLIYTVDALKWKHVNFKELVGAFAYLPNDFILDINNLIESNMPTLLNLRKIRKSLLSYQSWYQIGSLLYCSNYLNELFKHNVGTGQSWLFFSLYHYVQVSN